VTFRPTNTGSSNYDRDHCRRDSYRVLYFLAEVDPAIHTGDVIVADSVDGQQLGKDGAFKIVSTEERRPARWVRNLTEISVVEVKP
jgi:hypothetical protein